MYISAININQCLNFNELKLYIENKLSKEKQQNAFNHICNCTLCSHAVNGFANEEISLKEVQFINSFIDAKINNEKRAYKAVYYSGIIILSLV